ncbi:unnamed protein product [Acanthoscelides obtectus]|uniref:Uncharacterized protein n=1 Tax=Acanthoscelides obtectus TaxID=200917 RepID=A0A9P0KRU3_ACAOB|nr:unnamed protein product [Acanthoscelides obtectus]CAK1657227.1 hypothetical protein AOBTE_LOCUS20225 [Acanthoscelides obtectus]
MLYNFQKIIFNTLFQFPLKTLRYWTSGEGNSMARWDLTKRVMTSY